MKTIEVDDELYRYIASHTQHIGESASDILRRMLRLDSPQHPVTSAAGDATTAAVAQITALLHSPAYQKQARAVHRFIQLLSQLYTLDPQTFSRTAGEMQGRKRRYFASDQQTLLANGVHTKPKAVPGTPWWVITNTNTARKRSMITRLMSAMQFPASFIQQVCLTIQ